MDEPNKTDPVQPVASVTIVAADVLGAYKKMLLVQFGSTVGLAVVLFASLWIAFKSGTDSPALLPLIIGAGMMGALFSALMRLYNVDQAGVALITPTVKNLGGWYILIYSLVPPIVGAIAAVVLYLVFISKIVSSPLFPDISCVKENACKDILGLMRSYWPTLPEDYGKALVWSFLAGFSERLVPDVLQSLVAKSTKDDGH